MKWMEQAYRHVGIEACYWETYCHLEMNFDPLPAYLLNVVVSNHNWYDIRAYFGHHWAICCYPESHVNPSKGCTLDCCCQESHINLLKICTLEVIVSDMDGYVDREVSRVSLSLEVLLLLKAANGPVDSCAIDVGSCNIDGDFGNIAVVGVELWDLLLLGGTLWWQVPNKYWWL